MLRIRQVKHLAQAFRTSVDELSKVLSNRERFYEQLRLCDPAKPDKVRLVVNVRGPLRAFQSRFYRFVLLPKLRPSVYSHGGVLGRDVKTNASAHLGSIYACKIDIANFYPSIRYSRVYRLFFQDLECSPDVSRLCTMLCTYRHHLALGLITSPILADQMMARVDRRIGALCRKYELKYTRYVDDITISGQFNLEQSGFIGTLEAILRQDGFSTNPKKRVSGSLADGLSITGIRVRDDNLDVRKEYAAELERQLHDAASLARGEGFLGPYYTHDQLKGRLHFVSWINPRRRPRLMQLFRAVSWKAVETEASRRGLVASRKSLERADS